MKNDVTEHIPCRDCGGSTTTVSLKDMDDGYYYAKLHCEACGNTMMW